MDVTRENFSSILRTLEHEIPSCDLIGIDCEFTGLDHASATPGATAAETSIALDFEAGFEEAQHRYEKLGSATSFLVVQVGLCLFTYDDQKRSFIARPYNFYTFPSQFRGDDRRFLCQTRCMQFLAEQGFDFNKLLKSGIPFLGKHQERTVRDNSQETGEFITELRGRLVAFLADTSQATLVLPPTDAYHRKLAFTELSTVFKDVVKADKTMVEDRLCIQVHRAASSRELGVGVDAISSAIEERARQINEAEIKSAVGFRHVIDLVARFNKPIVGHNMLLDVVQLEAQFGDHLPEAFEDFRTQVSSRFPIIFDTKHMITSAPPSLAKNFGAGSRLDSVYKVLSGDAFRHPKVELAEGFGRYKEAAAHHEAGYDAFITGVAFLRISQHVVMSMDIPQRKNTSGLTPRLRQLAGSALPVPQQLLEGVQALGFANKIHLMGGKKLKSLRFGVAPEDSTDDVDGEEEGEPIEVEGERASGGDRASGDRWCFGGGPVNRRGRGRGRGGGGERESVHATPPRVNRHRQRDNDGPSGSGKKREEKRPRVSV